MAKENILDALWIEKYRPKYIDNNLILDNNLRNKFEEYIKNNSIPHLLFIGPPGTGKTTIAMALIKHIIKDNIDLLSLNGSSANGIDVVRETIIPFLSTPPKKSLIKIVFIDEADYLTANAFASLRNTIEQPNTNINFKTRFILTANYLNKIPTPILSRFTVFTLDSMSKENMLNRCIEILKNENIQYDINIVQKIIDNSYPDMRSVIKNMQSACQNNILMESNIKNTDKDILLNIEIGINANNIQEAFAAYNKCREIIDDNIDSETLFRNLLDDYIQYLDIHHIILKYYNMYSRQVIVRHTILGMLAEVINFKFGNLWRE